MEETGTTESLNPNQLSFNRVKQEIPKIMSLLKVSFEFLLNYYLFITIPILMVGTLFMGHFSAYFLWATIILQGIGKSIFYITIWRVIGMLRRGETVDFDQYLYYFKGPNFKRVQKLVIIFFLFHVAVDAVSLNLSVLLGIYGSFVILALSGAIGLLLQVALCMMYWCMEQRNLSWSEAKTLCISLWKKNTALILALVLVVAGMVLAGVTLFLFPLFFIALPLSMVLVENAVTHLLFKDLTLTDLVSHSEKL
jgi:hypothetical protein